MRERELDGLVLVETREIVGGLRRGGREKSERERPRARRAWLASRSERPELIADEVHRRDEHDRDRLRDDLAEPERDEAVEDEEVREQRASSRR